MIWNKTTKLETDDIITAIKEYQTSPEFCQLKEYLAYYEQRNTALLKSVESKYRRNKKPNNYVPTSYYATITDTMAGYMFQNVQYNPKNESDKAYAEALNEILEANDQDAKDMTTGTYSLATNKGIELVYTGSDAEIRYATFNPLEWVIVYDSNIEPNVFCGIWLQKSLEKDYDLYVDVFYKDLWQQFKYNSTSGQLVERGSEQQLFFDECPVVVYNSEIIGDHSPFHCVITYIQALDELITGNSNELEKLSEAILLLGRTLKEEDLKHIDEIKALMDITKDEIVPQFIQRQISPEFREYVSKLLINEIHKHSHVIDWYSPDTGLTGAVSAKALTTRLFDMNMYSQRIEKTVVKGARKKIRLISTLMNIKSLPTGEVNIIYNRTIPKDFEDKLMAFKGVDFISRRTIWEALGLDPEVEEERLTLQQESEPVEIVEDVDDEIVEGEDK